MNRLKQHQDQYASEKDRQLQLARLRREERKAQMEGRFESAAMLIGMSKEEGKQTSVFL